MYLFQDYLTRLNMNILFTVMGAGFGLLILVSMLLLCIKCSVDNHPFDRVPSEYTLPGLIPANRTSTHQQDTEVPTDEYC